MFFYPDNSEVCDGFEINPNKNERFHVWVADNNIFFGHNGGMASVNVSKGCQELFFTFLEQSINSPGNSELNLPDYEMYIRIVKTGRATNKYCNIEFGWNAWFCFVIKEKYMKNFA